MSNDKKRIFITKDDSITKNENNLVNLTLSDGTLHEALEPRRLFPVSNSSCYITLLDKSGTEIAVIRTLKDLNTDSLDVISFSLDDYYLVPHITKIISVTNKNGKIHWAVETDRGYKEFDVRSRVSDIKIYKDGRIRVRDTDDNRYIVNDYKTLDKHSRRALVADL